MKSVMFAAQSISSGYNTCVIAGGMEAMSNIPYYLPKARSGYRYGHGQVIDGLVHDGLTDAYDGNAMGFFADLCADKYGITREEQDEFALESYQRAANATQKNLFKEEIVAVEVKSKKGSIFVEEDEEIGNLQKAKVPSLRPVFRPNGTVTAANASSINDGAAALIIASEAFAVDRRFTPVARILAMSDAARMPSEFTDAPADAIPLAIARAGLTPEDIDVYEINEAFSVVALANMRLLNLDPAKVNLNGGAVALGHPIGCSGARIITTLVHVLQQQDKRYGVAAICNGGGGASAIVIERM
jgi:acetyl-CoA C-acetyltransferase